MIGVDRLAKIFVTVRTCFSTMSSLRNFVNAFEFLNYLWIFVVID